MRMREQEGCHLRWAKESFLDFWIPIRQAKKYWHSSRWNQEQFIKKTQGHANHFVYITDEHLMALNMSFSIFPIAEEQQNPVFPQCVCVGIFLYLDGNQKS